VAVELEQRQVWTRERARLGIADDALDVSKHPALALLDPPRIGVVVLPPDPHAVPLDFDDVHGSVPPQFTGRTVQFVSRLDTKLLTGQHALRAANEGKDAVAGVARHGGAVAGIGGAGVSEPDGDGGRRIYRLFALTAAVRIALETQATVLERHPDAGLPEGPWELTVVAPGASGALLGGYAPEWLSVDELDRPPRCIASSPVVRVEIDGFPPSDKIDRLLTQVMSRVVNLFGTAEPLYANQRAVSEGVPRNF